MSTYQTPESLARVLLGLYEDNYQTHIDEVIAAWASSDLAASREIVSFVDFEHRTITADPQSVAVAQFHPSLAIAMGNSIEVPDEELMFQQYANYYDLDMNVYYFIRGIDQEELGILLMRHVEASMRFYQAHPRLDCGKNIFTGNFRFEPSANVYRSGGNTLIKGLRIRFDVRYLQRGG